VVPQNTVVMIGTNLTLHCGTNTSTKLSWYFGHKQGKIFNGFDINTPDFPRHRMQLPFDLVISNVRPSDAGLYSCLHSKSHEATAEVIVLGKNYFVFVACCVCLLISMSMSMSNVNLYTAFS